MEYLVIAVILYFILRTAGNLVGLLMGSGGGTSERGRTRKNGPSHNWEGPSPRQQTGAARNEPTFWGKDIEDATWHEINDGSKRQGAAR